MKLQMKISGSSDSFGRLVKRDEVCTVAENNEESSQVSNISYECSPPEPIPRDYATRKVQNACLKTEVVLIQHYYCLKGPPQ